MNYPHRVQTRVSDETLALVRLIESEYGPKEALVTRLALDDYCPRYIAAKGKPKHTHFLMRVGIALEVDPTLEQTLEKVMRKHIRGVVA